MRLAGLSHKFFVSFTSDSCRVESSAVAEYREANQLTANAAGTIHERTADHHHGANRVRQQLDGSHISSLRLWAVSETVHRAGHHNSRDRIQSGIDTRHDCSEHGREHQA